MALVVVERLGVSYPNAVAPAVRSIELSMEEGERVALLGLSGAGKSTLIRSLTGLVPHFHGGRFEGRVRVGGLDTRCVRPADLVGIASIVFQDPEDQVVMTRVLREVTFGLENIGTPVSRIAERAEAALDAVGALDLKDRRTTELSGGELQRVCLAAALAISPRLLLLDEPTSQLDTDGARLFLDAVNEAECAVVLSEQRIRRALDACERAVVLEQGMLVFDGAAVDAPAWLEGQSDGLGAGRIEDPLPSVGVETVLELCGVCFSYGKRVVVDDFDLRVHAGEIIVLEGPNGCGKTTVAKLACGLLKPDEGTVERLGQAGYLSQDPGRYLVKDRTVDEVALAVDGRRAPALEALHAVDLDWAAERHPRDLSSGERERLAVAAVTVAAPDLLVLDEPTRGVDPRRKRQIELLARTNAAQGGSVLVATHDREFGAHRRVALGTKESVHV